MIRQHILALILLGLSSLLAGCVDRPLLDEPAYVGSGPYILGPGDRLRIVVYDQPSLTNLYEVDQSGQVSLPLVGDVPAGGSTVDELARRIEVKLASGYLRDPNVTAEIATYRPYFVLGEVQTPGQFVFTPGLTVEKAVAAAGGYTERANRRVVRLSRTVNGELFESKVLVIEPIRPGDTVYVPESLF